MITVILKLLQLILVTTGEYPVNRFANPTPRLYALIHVIICLSFPSYYLIIVSGEHVHLQVVLDTGSVDISMSLVFPGCHYFIEVVITFSVKFPIKLFIRCSLLNVYAS
jgi:hypothetical protein